MCALWQVSATKPVDENTSPPKPKFQRRRVVDSPLDDSVIHVVNRSIGCVHLFLQRSKLFRFKDPKSVCSSWSCGTPDMPAKGAIFSTAFDTWKEENSAYGFCERCCGDCYPKDRCVATPVKSKGKDSSSDSSSSSESES